MAQLGNSFSTQPDPLKTGPLLVMRAVSWGGASDASDVGDRLFRLGVSRVSGNP